MEEYNEISRIIADKLLGRQLTDEENNRLKRWLEASPSHLTAFERIRRMYLTERIVELENTGYGQKTAKRVLQQIRKPADKRAHRLSLRISVWSSVAAVIIAVAGLSYMAWFDTKPVLPLPVVVADHIVPGKTEATLTLANGRELQITQTNSHPVEKLIDSLYTTPATTKSSTKNARTIQYHTLSIPSGGEFYCVLSDSTRVWLNSQTELRFPDTFEGEQRRVYLKGEAYFDVAHRSKPFVVSLSSGDISVYGTRFNVMDYPEQPLSAVLVDGSIGFTSASGKTARLKPSERMVYDTANEHITMQTVDTSLYTSWVDHYFVFEGQTLEDIMTTLARWYNFTPVFTADEMRFIRLSGRLYRSDNIEVLLNGYERTTGLRFILNGTNIIITK